MTMLNEMMTRCFAQPPIKEDEEFWDLPKFAEMPGDQFLAARLRPEDAVHLLRMVRHNLQVVADDEGRTGPVTEAVLAIDVILQSMPRAFPWQDMR